MLIDNYETNAKTSESSNKAIELRNESIESIKEIKKLLEEIKTKEFLQHLQKTENALEKLIDKKPIEARDILELKEIAAAENYWQGRSIENILIKGVLYNCTNIVYLLNTEPPTFFNIAKKIDNILKQDLSMHIFLNREIIIELLNNALNSSSLKNPRPHYFDNLFVLISMLKANGAIQNGIDLENSVLPNLLRIVKRPYAQKFQTQLKNLALKLTENGAWFDVKCDNQVYPHVKNWHENTSRHMNLSWLLTNDRWTTGRFFTTKSRKWLQAHPDPKTIKFPEFTIELEAARNGFLYNHHHLASILYIGRQLHKKRQKPT